LRIYQNKKKWNNHVWKDKTKNARQENARKPWLRS
jgi:hypothetical protein